MAKTRAQRKAEKRAREAQQQRQGQAGQQPSQPAEQERQDESHAQHDTQVPVSGDVAEFEASMETQTPPPDSTAEIPEAPAPSRADTPPPAEPPKKSRRELRAERKAEKERERKQLESQQQLRKGKEAPTQERQRGAVIGFLISCWAELKKVQWPDRDTLVQASAVTLIFVAVMAAYLGALDAAFNWLVQKVL
jgi:preprotein translocase SecE subunit